MLIWPLVVLGAALAGAGLAGVLWWWPQPGRCVGAGLVLAAGAALELVAASARSGVADGEVAALVLVVLAGAQLAAALGRSGRR